MPAAANHDAQRPPVVGAPRVVANHPRGVQQLAPNRQRSRSFDDAAHGVAGDHGEHCLHTARTTWSWEQHHSTRYQDADVDSFLSKMIGFVWKLGLERDHPKSISVAHEIFDEHTRLTARRECFNKFQNDAQFKDFASQPLDEDGVHVLRAGLKAKHVELLSSNLLKLANNILVYSNCMTIVFRMLTFVTWSVATADVFIGFQSVLTTAWERRVA